MRALTDGRAGIIAKVFLARTYLYQHFNRSRCLECAFAAQLVLTNIDEAQIVVFHVLYKWKTMRMIDDMYFSAQVVGTIRPREMSKHWKLPFLGFRIVYLTFHEIHSQLKKLL